MEAGSTPNYNKLRSMGAVIPYTSFVRTDHKIDRIMSNYNYVRKNTANNWVETDYPDGYPGDVSGHLPYPVIDLTTLYSPTSVGYAAQRAVAGLNRSSMDALTFVAELSKAREMCFRLVKRILAARTQWFDARKALNAVPGLWLEARFGLRPFIGDLNSIVDIIQNTNRMRKMLYSNTAQLPSTLAIPSWTATATIGTNAYILTQTVNYECSISYRGSAVGVMQNSGFGFNPIATAWELVPWSFVVDWLLDVGTMISMASNEFLSEGVLSCGGYKISVLEQRTQVITPYSSVIPCTIYTGGTRTSSVYQERCERIPGVADYTLNFHNRIDPLKGIDAMMLGIQQLAKLSFSQVDITKPKRG